MDFDRAKEIKAFDETKAGVKGLLDSGLKKVPKIFIRPQDELEAEKLNRKSDIQVPVIDLSSLLLERESIVEKVLFASEKWGFFQVVNHGIPESVLDEMISGVREFNEQDEEVKKVYYSRDYQKHFRFDSNYDLFQSRTANWRDTIHVSVYLKDQFDPNELPEICRDSTTEYINHITKISHTLFELLSEALGLEPDYLNSIECTKGKSLISHYYPSCPEPELTLGIGKHSDASFITILLQDQIGGLQIVHENQWVDVKPIHGALLVNIGDSLQMISNDKFKSVEHRVVPNKDVPRISTVCFFMGGVASERVYSPIKQLISEEKPQLYKDFTMGEVIAKFLTRSVDKPGLDIFKI